MSRREILLGIAILITAFVFIASTLAVIVAYRQAETPVSAALPQQDALVDTYLTSGITDDATSMTLAEGTTQDGATLSGRYCFTLDNNSPLAEYICGTASGTSVTDLERGVKMSNPNATSSALAHPHRRLASVQVSDFPFNQLTQRRLNGIDPIENMLYYSSGISTSTQAATSTQTLASIAYVNFVATAGCANASETERGCVELATQIESASSTAIGSTGAALAQKAEYATSSPGTAAIWDVWTDNAGKIAQGFLDLTAAFVWTGVHRFNSGFILDEASSTVNGVGYGFPSSVSTTTETVFTLTNNQIAALKPNGYLIASSTVTGATATTTVSIASAGTDLDILLDVPSLSAASDLNMQFNTDTAGNYGTMVSNTPAAVVSQSSASNLRLTGDPTNGANGAYCLIHVSNSFAQRKKVMWSCAEYSSGAQPSELHIGSGVWNNTSSVINSVSFGAGLAGATLGVGTRISVYSSRN